MAMSDIKIEDIESNEELKKNISILAISASLSVTTIQDLVKTFQGILIDTNDMHRMKVEFDKAALVAAKFKTKVLEVQEPSGVNPYYRQYKRWK